MRRIDFGFWARIALTSLFVNVPLAFAMVVYGLHPAFAFAFSGLAGMGTLLIWDRRREEPEAIRSEASERSVREEATPATVTLRTRRELVEVS